jgi:hypothetical protein
VKYITLVLTFLLAAATAAFVQTPAGMPAMADKLTGNYEGTIAGQNDQVELHLKNDGKPLGRLQVGQKTYDITEAMVSDGNVSLVFNEGKLTGKLQGDKIIGDLWIGSEKKAIELRKIPPTPATPATPSTPGTPPAKFVPNGEWEAMADANGQPFPFLLTLRVDGEKVTGASSSQLGEGTIKDGTWKDGKLSFQIEGTNGTIAMSATVVDGKLSGDFDYAGQLSGKWVAVRKTP